MEVMRYVKDEFPDLVHIASTPLGENASYRQIWAFALASDSHIITNDEDFYKLAVINGYPPKRIILRTGNQSTKFIHDILLKHKLEIIQFVENRDYGVLEIY